MAESFLEEQLKRILELSERMSQVKSHAAEMAEAREREREQGSHNPLHAVRDFRTYRGGATQEPRRRSTARDSSRRKR